MQTPKAILFRRFFALSFLLVFAPRLSCALDLKDFPLANTQWKLTSAELDGKIYQPAPKPAPKKVEGPLEWYDAAKAEGDIHIAVNGPTISFSGSGVITGPLIIRTANGPLTIHSFTRPGYYHDFGVGYDIETISIQADGQHFQVFDGSFSGGGYTGRDYSFEVGEAFLHRKPIPQTVGFYVNGLLVLHDGCNSGSGLYFWTAADTVSTEYIATTQVACSGDGDLILKEEVFARAIGDTKSRHGEFRFQRKGTTLELFSVAPKGKLIFEQIEGLSQTDGIEALLQTLHAVKALRETGKQPDITSPPQTP